MVKKVTCMLVMLLLCGLFALTRAEVKAQTASPSQAVITVSGVPTGTQGLAVEVTVDTAVVTLGSGSSDVSGSLVVSGSMSEGVGLISTSGNLPASFTITVPLTGVAAGTSMVAVGKVLDMLGGTAITGATAMVDISSVTVASSSSSTSSTSSSTGGAGGMLSADTFTVTVTGNAVKQTNALNVTVAFSDSTVATLATGVSFMGTGATQLLTDVNVGTGVLTAVWDGSITDGVATITGMLAAGSMGGRTNLAVTKVEAAGGTDITTNVVAQVAPTSVTNSSTTASSDCGTFVLVAPSSATGSGKVAVAFTIKTDKKDLSATLNSKKVDIVTTTQGKPNVGFAILDLPSMGDDLALSLSAMCNGMTVSADLGKISVKAGDGGKGPKVASAAVSNTGSASRLVVRGSNFLNASKNSTTVTILPTDRKASKTRINKSNAKLTYPVGECIPRGSYVNLTTPSGTDAKKIKVGGSCKNTLL